MIDGNRADNITNILLTALMHGRGLSLNSVREKLICFRANGAFVFQGTHNGVAMQMSRQFALYMMFVHDIAYRTNFDVLSIIECLSMLKKL